MEFDCINDLKSVIGREIKGATWFEVTQELVNEFAHATKDFQWIHTDPEMAKKHSPFGAPVAHGFYSLSLIPKFIGDTIHVKSAKMGVNYGLNKVRFPNAVPVGSKLRCHFTVMSIEDYPPRGAKITWKCLVEIEGKEKPACVAEMVSLMFE